MLITSKILPSQKHLDQCLTEYHDLVKLTDDIRHYTWSQIQAELVVHTSVSSGTSVVVKFSEFTSPGGTHQVK